MKESDLSIRAVDRNGTPLQEHDVVLIINEEGRFGKWRVIQVHPNGAYDVIPEAQKRVTVTDPDAVCLFLRDPALRKGLTADDRELLEELVERAAPKNGKVKPAAAPRTGIPLLDAEPEPRKNGNGKPCSRCKAAPRERGCYCIECKRIIMHEYHLKKMAEREAAAVNS